MFFASSKSKFHQQSRLVHYVKIISLLLIIITPFALLQFTLLSASYKKFNHDKQIQISDRNSTIQPSEHNNRDRSIETIQEHVYAKKSDQLDQQLQHLEPNVNGRVGELFDVNRFLNVPKGQSQYINKSVLRIRRQSSFEGLTTRPPQTLIDQFISHLPEAHDGNLELLKALERSPEEQAIKNMVQDGQAVASEQNGATAIVGPDSNRLSQRTMVMVSSKTGEFNKLLPLDDLIVSPATESQLNNPDLVSDRLDNSQNSIGREADLAELTAAGTAAGIFLSGLATHNNFVGTPYSNNQFEGSEVPFKDEGGGASGEIGDDKLFNDGRPILKHSPSLKSYSEAQSTSAYQTKDNNQRLEDQMPDSMESLMAAEGEDIDERDGDSNEPTQYAANENDPQEITNLNRPAPLSPPPDEREDTDSQIAHRQALEGYQRRQKLSSMPSSNTFSSSGYPTNFDNSQPDELSHLYSQPTPDGIMVSNHHQLMAPMRDSYNDLNVAAGHYYGKKKKKKKKVVKKKKKVKIVKYKKKKVKKVKKVKVKKVVIKKKKKKKKKKKAHHDHGKYYMYAKVPKKKTWEFGFKKGNKKHWIERHEKGHKNKFKTKVKWYDKKSKGKGVHIWDYNHHDKKKKKHYG